MITGFVADIIYELQSLMHFEYTIDVAHPSTDYHTLVSFVAGDNPRYEMVVSDVRITSNRLRTVDFSAPIHENTFRVITRDDSETLVSSLFLCLYPFTVNVWLSIGGVMIYSGALFYCFEYRHVKRDQNRSLFRATFIGIFEMISNIMIKTGASTLTCSASRIVGISLYGFSIIIIAIYTANLSAFLTLTRSRSLISGIDDIKNGRLPYSRVGIVTNSALSDYYIQSISTIYQPLSSPDSIFQSLLNYTIDASMWNAAILEYAVAKKYCDQLTIVGVGFVRSSYGIALPKNWPYKSELDRAILAIRESQRFECFESQWFSQSKCSESKTSSNEYEGLGTNQFSFNVMSGIFLLYLIVTVVAIGLHIANNRNLILPAIWRTIKRT
jgi:ABC-type amino acid transport substrate-binding protein